MFTTQSILDQLDTEAESYIFPMLDNGYYYHGDQKMTIFRDDNRWAILLEVLEYNNHEYGIEGITTVASVFGNCLLGTNGNDSFLYYAADDGVPTFIMEEGSYYSFLNPEAKTIKVRNQVIPVIRDKHHYLAKGIEFGVEGKILPWEFMRGLIPEYSNLFWVIRDEIANKIPRDLQEFMVLHHWHHPDLAMGEKPSDKETFRQLADVIVTGNKGLYNTGEVINTHWKNWPNGGGL